MRKYEIMFIIKPDVPEEEVDKLAAQMQGVATGAGGKVEKLEKMGRRRLAYRIGRYREGFYVLFAMEGSGDMVKEFERRLKVNDAVIKFITVRTDEELKRTEKVKALRAERAAKQPKPKPPAPPAFPESQVAEAAQP